jgi:hypothetical protein
LKGLSKVISAKRGMIYAFCMTNAFRPVLCLVGSLSAEGGIKKMLYVEAVKKYWKKIKEVNFEQSYKLALPMFKDRLEQTFLVLTDAESTNTQSTEQTENRG